MVLGLRLEVKFRAWVKCNYSNRGVQNTGLGFGVAAGHLCYTLLQACSIHMKYVKHCYLV